MIRKMIEKDLTVIDTLEKELFTSPWPIKEYLYELNENPFANVYVLEEDGEIVGYFDYWILYEQAQIATIGTKKSHQSQGYGQKMLEFIIEQANQNKCEVLSLEVRISNEKAIRLYEKNGFIKVNVRKNYYTDNGEDAYLMVKPLGGEEDDDVIGD